MPYLGVFVYLIARGHKMSEHARAAQAQDAAIRSYVQSAAGSGEPRRRDRPARRARDQGAISEEEFQQAKAKALA